MLKAHWSGYEIDSSEAAYNVKVPRPQELGTLMRAFLRSGYFATPMYLVFEEPLLRLHDFITERGNGDRLAAKALKHLDKQIAKFNPRRWTTIGVLAIEAILNYVGANRQALRDAQVFHFEPTEDQEEIWDDVDYEFTPGEKVDETVFYSESEIPLDGVVIVLGLSFEKASKLPPKVQKRGRQIARRAGREMEEMSGPAFFGESWADMLVNGLERPEGVSLRVRLNPDATLSVTGRWMEDGQFLYRYYSYLLDQAAEAAKAKIDFDMIY